MPHAALFVVQEQLSLVVQMVSSFQCRTRLCLWCKDFNRSHHRRITCFNAARGFVCGARCCKNMRGDMEWCFNAARGFVCGARLRCSMERLREMCFNAARGFVCGARPWIILLLQAHGVSMPHAALFVVQVRIIKLPTANPLFQCRTRLCLWCKFQNKNNTSSP